MNGWTNIAQSHKAMDRLNRSIPAYGESWKIFVLLISKYPSDKRAHIWKKYLENIRTHLLSFQRDVLRYY